MTALRGLKVIDLSRHAPGPYCTMLLADLGADVVVVEQPPGQGRSVGAEMGIGRKERLYNPVGRNKRSVALDLKDAAAHAACLKLIEDADIVVEGFRPGVAKRLGLDYETLREINPRLIYCSISGYGQNGPYRDYVGHDLNYISIGGVLGMVGQKDGPPTIPVNIIGDYAGGGLFAAFAILAAVVARNSSGEGQYIDMAMSDGVLSLANLAVCDYLSSGTPPRPGEYFLNGALPCYSVYECADGKWLAIGCMEPWFWARLCKQLDMEQYAREQFNARLFPEMFAILRRKLKEKPRDAWFAQFAPDDICATPVLGIEEVLDDPHNRARGMAVELEDAEFGKIRQVGIAPKFSATPGSVRSLPPDPGQHTREILGAAGIAADVIEQLLAAQ
ncbi:L-carnitine dehydratase/bile acid-inducible protein F [Sterolibacterium denitrificans]|nr:CoA transferase [Sterolibacterium denitrificans]SMB21449.1 L-carnitine dehydratase/bile acid-inducible protein F [Sterolibacterium denitrificans]